MHDEGGGYGPGETTEQAAGAAHLEAQQKQKDHEHIARVKGGGKDHRTRRVRRRRVALALNASIRGLRCPYRDLRTLSA